MRRPLRLRAAHAQGVSAVFAAHARRTRRGVPVRCQQSRFAQGPIIFPSRTAALAAVEALAEAGARYTPAVCVRGRHWHLQPVFDVPEEQEHQVVAIPHPQDEPDEAAGPPSWLVPRDGATVRAEVRERVGDEQPVPPEFDGPCLTPSCDACRKAARWGSVG